MKIIKIIFKCILAIIIVILTLIIIYTALDILKEVFREEQYYYECIDTFGNSVICEKMYNSYGQLWGITEDGTAVQITKGKKVVIEE